MPDREILLVATGGLIGLVSSLATLFTIYLLEGMRLRRQWEREDRMRLTEKRDEIEAILKATRQEQSAQEETNE